MDNLSDFGNTDSSNIFCRAPEQGEPGYRLARCMNEAARIRVLRDEILKAIDTIVEEDELVELLVFSIELKHEILRKFKQKGETNK